MLTHSRIVTVLPVVDLDRARRFYEERLGLAPGKPLSHGGIAYRLGGESAIELSPREEPTKNQYTALSFEVDDVEREVRELEGRGVRFEDYDLPQLKTEHHVARLGEERVAWFKDSEGNILCVHEGSAGVQ